MCRQYFIILPMILVCYLASFTRRRRFHLRAAAKIYLGLSMDKAHLVARILIAIEEPESIGTPVEDIGLCVV